MTHTITIPNWRPSALNALLSAGRWRAAAMKKSDRQTIGAYARNGNTPKATGKRRVSLEITLRGRQQETDPDAYWKSLNDALVHAGLLIDDSREWCELGTVDYNRSGEARTTIVLVDIN